jgi:hypothetical protein
VKRWALLLAVALLGACAPLSTLTMSDRCRDQYNACLDSCRGTDGDGLHMEGPVQTQQNPGFMLRSGTASCTDGCSKDSKSCK